MLLVGTTFVFANNEKVNEDELRVESECNTQDAEGDTISVTYCRTTYEEV